MRVIVRHRPKRSRPTTDWGMTMIAIHRGIAWSIAFATASTALFLLSTPAAARHDVRSIEVGPIWNQMDADRKCPEAARRAGGTWTGQWRTTRPGQASECDIRMERHGGFQPTLGQDHMFGHDHKYRKERSVEVGPIWNQMDADRKCPEAARRAGGTWTGQWRTTQPGRVSECDIKR